MPATPYCGARYFGRRYFGPRYFLTGSTTVVATKTLEESLVAALLANTALVAKCGTRIYAEVAPQKIAMPFVCFLVDSEDFTFHLTGRGKTRDASITIDCLAMSVSDRRAMTEAVLAQLGTFTGNLGGTGGVFVAETSIEPISTDHVRLADGTDRVARLASLRFTMRYTGP